MCIADCTGHIDALPFCVGYLRESLQWLLWRGLICLITILLGELGCGVVWVWCGCGGVLVCGVWVWCGCVGGHGHGVGVCFVLCVCVCVFVHTYVCVFLCLCWYMHVYSTCLCACILTLCPSLSVSPLLTTVLSTSLD